MLHSVGGLYHIQHQSQRLLSVRVNRTCE